MSAHVLFVDLDSIPCLDISCQNFAQFIRPSLVSWGITLHAENSSVERLSLQPSLIIARSTSTKLLAEALRCFRNRWERIPVFGIICGIRSTSSEVLPLLNNDLDDFFSCPPRENDVLPRILRVLKADTPSTPSRRARELKEQLHLETLVGESKCFLDVLEKLPAVARSAATVLISGETGTGKELFARAIHYLSPRSSGPFIPVNCGAVPDHLFENELFGHVKGAFTDASSTEKGLLGFAENGTLFLDEVDALSASAQVKLLRFLQDREYRPLGCAKSVVADVRIVAATNVDLRKRVEARLFREDFYHRLNILALQIPLLRKRRDDIPDLANHFLNKYAARYCSGARRLDASAMRKLTAYLWPGNVRELEAVIHRAVAMSTSSNISAAQIELPAASEHLSAVHLREAKTRTIEEFERRYLIDLLAAHRGNLSRAAKEAGKDRRAFQRLLQKYSLRRSDFNQLHTT